AFHASTDLLRLRVPADEGGVQVLLVVSEIDVRVLRRLGAVGWLACDKATDLYHVPGDTRARAHVFKVGERGRRADLGNVDSWSGRGKRSRNTKQDEACDAADHGSWTRDQVRSYHGGVSVSDRQEARTNDKQ